MKTIKKGIFLGILALSVGAAYGMEERENKDQEGGLRLPNTYKGQSITPQTLVNMVDEVPEEIRKEVAEYEANNPGLIKKLTKIDISKGQVIANQKGQVSLIFPEQLEAGKILANGNISNNRCNFIFKTGDNTIAKISGFPNRIVTKLVSIYPERPITNVERGYVKGDFWRNQDFRKKVFSDLIQIGEQDPKTYQTVSRAAAALVINELGFKDVQAPKTYVMPVGGEKLTSVEDNDCFVVQEYIKDAKPVDTMTKEEIKEIDPKTIANYATVLTNAGLFTPRILVKDGILYVVDLEQPNNFDGNLFRYQPYVTPSNEVHAKQHIAEYCNSIGAGWREIPSSILQVPEHKRALAEVFATNNNIQELRKQGHFGDIENKLKES